MTDSAEFQTLLEANHAYRIGKPIMTDSEFDARERAFAEANPDHAGLALLRNDALGATTGKLFTWAGSQQKAMNSGEITGFTKRWYNGKGAHVSYKYDGASGQVLYKDGRLVKALTKGDGETGTDITPIIAATLRSWLPLNEDLTLRVEICLAKHRLAEVNERLIATGREPFQNTRNAVPAIIRAQDKYRDLFPKLEVIVFDVPTTDRYAQTRYELLERIKGMGFKIAHHTAIYTNTAEQLDASLTEYLADITVRRAEYDFEIDGLVVAPDNLDYGRSLGTTPDNKYRNGEFAIKFEAEGGITTITDIEWSAEGRNYISPIAVLDPPLFLSGANISRVGLKSPEWLETHKVGIGTKVLVVRSGDVIPYIPTDGQSKPLPGSIVDNTLHRLNTPTHCPVCKSETTRDGARLACTNADCDAKVAADMVHFCSTLKVKGMGYDTALKAIPFGVNLKYLARCRKVHQSQITPVLEAMKAASAPGTLIGKVLDQLRSPDLRVTLPQYVVACGVSNLGLTMAEHIFKDENNDEKFFNALCHTSLAYRTFPTGGIMGERAISVRNSFLARTDVITEWSDWVSKEEPAAPVAADPSLLKIDLSGKYTCMSGGGPRPRPVLTAELKAAGAIPQEDVNKTTQVLIVADKNSTSSKVVKAKKNGVEVLQYDEVF